MLALAALVALVTLLYGYAESGCRYAHPLRLPLVQFLVMGINLTFCTGDLFNLFVAFEIMLIASYALLTLEADDWDVKHAFPYVANLVVKSSLFLIGGTAALLNRTDDLSRMGHLWKQMPWLGVLFLFQALSLAGIPPLSGFWGKYLIVTSGLEKGAFVLVAGSIVGVEPTIITRVGSGPKRF
jgi:formate hydrogenlyase subunit 3/multisubunit Na+/H+ antiporter MnhD subunit